MGRPKGSTNKKTNGETAEHYHDFVTLIPQTFYRVDTMQGSHYFNDVGEEYVKKSDAYNIMKKETFERELQKGGE